MMQMEGSEANKAKKPRLQHEQLSYADVARSAVKDENIKRVFGNQELKEKILGYLEPEYLSSYRQLREEEGMSSGIECLPAVGFPLANVDAVDNGPLSYADAVKGGFCREDSRVTNVFQNPLLVKKILGYVDFKDLLSCRQVGKHIWTTLADEHLLKIGSQNQKLEVNKSNTKFQNHMDWLRENVHATWFTKTEHIEQFMNDMNNDEFLNRNPFPTRTVVFALSSSDEMANTEISDIPLRYILALNRFKKKYGRDVRNCFLALSYSKDEKLEFANHLTLLCHLYSMKELQFVNIFNESKSVIDLSTGKDPCKSYECLKQLKNVQIFGEDSWRWFRVLFFNTGNASQIENLHLGLGSDPEYEDFYKSSKKLPNLKKLVLNNYSWKVKGSDNLGGSAFNKLEELQVFFANEKEFRLQSITDILRFVDFNCSDTIKKLSLHTQEIKTGMDCSKIINNTGRKALRKLTKRNPYQYPNLEMFSLTYDILVGVPCDLVASLMDEKFPWCRELHVRNASLELFDEQHKRLRQGLYKNWPRDVVADNHPNIMVQYVTNGDIHDIFVKVVPNPGNHN